MNDQVYSGNSFSVARVGSEWEIWRFCDDDGNRERILLTTEGMDELASYFAEHFADEHRLAAQREP